MSRGEAHPGDELYGLAPEAFIEGRETLVRELKRAGKADLAAAVGRLRKPAIHLWAVNHLARVRALAVTRLLSAATSLSEAQDLALAGTPGTGARLRQDSGDYQRSLDLAVREAMALLKDAARGSGEEVARRVREVLAGAALGDEEVRARLAAGVLREEPPPRAAVFGFGAAVPAGGDIVDQAPVPADPAIVPKRPPTHAVKAGPISPVRKVAGTAVADDRRVRHRQRLEARRRAETLETTARRLAEVARRARRRAAVAAAAAESAETEALEAEARESSARADADLARARVAELSAAE